MAFFRNATVNLLNIHSGVFALVMSGGGAFYSVYLLRAGVPAPGVLFFMADGWISSGYFMAWQISLFVTLSENFSAYGGAMALAALVGAGAGMLLGRLIDAGHGARAVILSVTVFATVITLRALSQGHVLLAVIANAGGAFVACLYTPTLMTPVYNLAKAAPCTLRFHVATEGGWDIGASAGCLLAAGLMSLGAPISVGVALSLVGLAAAFVMLTRYYSTLGRTEAVAATAVGETP